MLKSIPLTAVLIGMAVPAVAQEPTWRNDVKPMVEAHSKSGLVTGHGTSIAGENARASQASRKSS